MAYIRDDVVKIQHSALVAELTSIRQTLRRLVQGDIGNDIARLQTKADMLETRISELEASCPLLQG